MGIARELAYKRVRTELRRGKHVSFQTEVPEESTMATIGPEELDEVHLAIEDLPTGERECVRLRFFDDLETEVVSERLGISRRMVQHRLQGACERLRDRLSVRLAPMVVGAILAPSAGEASVLPPIPKELDRRMEELIASHPEQFSGPGNDSSASGSSRLSRGPGRRAITTAIFLATVLIGSVWLALVFFGGHRGDSSLDRVADFVAAVVPDTAPAGNEREVASRSLAPAADETPNRERARRVEAEGATPKDAQAPAGPTAIDVAIVDEDGDPVRYAFVVVLPPGEVPTTAEPMIDESEAANPIEMGEVFPGTPLHVELGPEYSGGKSLTVVVQADQYPWLEGHRLAVPSSGDGRVNIALDSTPASDVMVRDAVSGEIVERATVKASTSVEGPERLQIIQSISSSEGQCTFRGHLPDPYDIKATAWGYEDAFLRGKRLADLDEIWLRPADIQPDSAFTVYVFDANGKPRAGAPVVCASMAERMEGQTDAEGRCEFGELVPGVYELGTEPGAAGKNRFLGFMQAPLAAGESRTVFLGGAELAKARVSVVDPRGRPLSGLTVRFDGMRTWNGITDERGRAPVFKPLAPGIFEVLIIGETEWSFTEKRLIEPGAQKRVRLIAGTASVVGRVIHGKRIRVEACVLASEDRSGRTAVRSGGRFELSRVVPGAHRFDVELRGLRHRLWRSVEVVVDAASDTVELDAGLEELGILEVTVPFEVNVGAGEVDVTCVDADGREGRLWQLPSGTRSLVYGAALPAASYEIHVRTAGGKTWGETVRVAADRRTRRQVDFE